MKATAAPEGTDSESENPLGAMMASFPIGCLPDFPDVPFTPAQLAELLATLGQTQQAAPEAAGQVGASGGPGRNPAGYLAGYGPGRSRTSGIDADIRQLLEDRAALLIAGRPGFGDIAIHDRAVGAAREPGQDGGQVDVEPDDRQAREQFAGPRIHGGATTD